MDAQEKVKEMISQKDQIEKEIKELYDVLASQQGNVGMNEPLVDREGYPRNDIDVYQIRISRNRISCLQNDHKNLMKEIEKELHGIHAHYKVEKPSVPKVDIVIQDASRPFASINLVSVGSPAEAAGLRVGDEVMEFGSVNASNFQSLQSIATVVSHSEGKSLQVKVMRVGLPLRVMLIPKKWSGRGLLGCNILPL